MIGISEAELIEIETRARGLRELAEQSVWAWDRNGDVSDRESAEIAVASDVLTLVELCRRAGFNLGR